MKKYIRDLLLLTAFTISIIHPVDVKAETNDEKIIEVPINKNYKSATFKLTFDYFEDYDVVIKSPSKETYEATKVQDTTLECAINNVEAGQWQVIISYPDEEKTSDASNKVFKDDKIGEPREISHVKVQVEGSTESAVDVSKDITVATDIVGLKMYFKDDDFIAEWTDTTCGNVNVEVTNAKNLQKLDKQTIKENSYSLEIPSNVEEIVVRIVPSVSESVEGAASSYTFKVNNNPDATVTYEELSITNKDSIKATCDLKESLGVKILVNGKQILEQGPLEKGNYEFDVPIDTGTNDILVYIVDKDGNMRSTATKVEKDVIAPSLELVTTYDGIVTEDEYLTIEGKVDDFDKLMINNAQVEVEGDNTFKFDYKLKEGVNEISVIAYDLAGNETIYEISCERVIPTEEPIPWLKIIICASLVGLLVLYILEVLRKRKNPKEEVQAAMVKENSEYESIDVSNLSKQEKNKLLKGPHIIWEMLSFAIPVAAAVFVLSFVIMVSVVASGSMEPRLNVGSTVIYNRLSYVVNDPARGDVVTFFSDEFNDYYGKRIIGVPGDEIEFKDGYVVINGQYCDESAYLDKEVETNCTKIFTVPEGCYFMLGDNRENSYDSRYWQNPYISKEKIVGKYMGQIDFSFQYDVINRILGA